MKEKLEAKINELMEYLMAKPVEEMTKEDYEIMSSELRDIRFREERAIQDEVQRIRMEQLMAASFYPVVGCKSTSGNK